MILNMILEELDKKPALASLGVFGALATSYLTQAVLILQFLSLLVGFLLGMIALGRQFGFSYKSTKNKDNELSNNG